MSNIKPQCARALPLWPRWGYDIIVGDAEGIHKCVENRRTPVGYTTTCCMADHGCVYACETKTVDKGVPKSERLRVAPHMPSAVIGVVRIVAILDNSNPVHFKALMDCPATRRWFCPEGKTTAIVFSHCARIPPMPYKGQQGYHFLPGMPLASSWTDLTRILSPEDEAVFAALHAAQPRKSAKRKRAPET